MSFLGALLPSCEQVDRCAGEDMGRSRGLCYHVRPSRARGECRSRSRKPRGRAARPARGRAALDEGCGLEGAPASVGSITVGLGGRPSSPAPPGRTIPKGWAASQSPTMWKILMASYGIVIATTFFKKHPAFCCKMLRD